MKRTNTQGKGATNDTRYTIQIALAPVTQSTLQQPHSKATSPTIAAIRPLPLPTATAPAPEPEAVADALALLAEELDPADAEVVIEADVDELPLELIVVDESPDAEDEDEDELSAITPSTPPVMSCGLVLPGAFCAADL